MDRRELQQRLKASGRYAGQVDDAYGPLTRAGVLLAMTDGPDTKLNPADYITSAARLGVTPAHVKAIKLVESSGEGFAKGRPVLLFEPHRFSKATKGRFNASAPDVSYPTWDPKKYPGSQDGRYAQLVKAVGLDVDAGFASASYGLFQILGENHGLCGFSSSFEFAVAQAKDEIEQLRSLEQFLMATGLHLALRRSDWAAFAKGYNGTAYRQNKYDTRLEAAYIAAGGR
jgi:hypothetical protein